MSKQIDQEQLFGRLDLSSIVPGHVSRSIIDKDRTCLELEEKLKKSLEEGVGQQTEDMLNCLKVRKDCLAELYGGIPEIITRGKIPDAHVCFLDECFKANDGIHNSLLTALNEREYTNEGVTVKIPTISFFAASNEIPNFKNPEEKQLKPLYDRFDFKLHTEYVGLKENRMKILKLKQSGAHSQNVVQITLAELGEMQDEILTIIIPDSINEIMDAILCELRRKDIHVSDRTYFNFGSVVQAEAWLKGRSKVEPQDLLVLVNYLWNTPEEATTIEDVIRRLSENPMGKQLEEIRCKIFEIRDAFHNASDCKRALPAFRSSALQVFDEITALKNASEDETLSARVEGLIQDLEGVSREAHNKAHFTYIPMEELKSYAQIA